MEEFGYKTSYKTHRFFDAGYPVLGLIFIFVYWVAVVAPSEDSTVRFTFPWWMPLFALGLVVWAAFEIVSTVAVYQFKVRLSDDAIEIGSQRILWEDVVGAEFKPGFGQQPAAIVYASDGRMLKIPAAVESYAYIKGVIEGHTAEKVSA